MGFPPLLATLLLSLSVTTSALSPSPPFLNKPLKSQLISSNPAVSSVFFVSPYSALLVNSSKPAVRVPPLWSFSIGLNGDTFIPAPGSSKNLIISAEMDNGERLPDWLVFSPDMFTLGGVAPASAEAFTVVISALSGDNLTSSDSFTLAVSDHDLSFSAPLPSQNITAGSPFAFTIDVFEDLFVDDAPFNKSMIGVSGGISNMSVAADVSGFPWLSFDKGSSILSGTTSGTIDYSLAPIIPVFVSCTFPTQTLTVSTNLTLFITESLFNETALPALQVAPGMKIAFWLSPYLKFSPGWTISATFTPDHLTWLSFDPDKLSLNGTVPQDSPEQIDVAFVGDNNSSGITSQMQLNIEVNKRKNASRTRDVSDFSTKIKFALGLVFGIFASVILIVVLLAIRRQCQPPPSDFDIGIITSCAYNPPPPIERVYASPIVRAFTRLPNPNVCVSRSISDTGRALFEGLRKRFNFGRKQAGENGSSDSGFRFGAGGDGGSENASGTPGRPRKSKIGNPIAILTGSTGLLADLTNIGRAGSMRYTQSQNLNHTLDSPASQHERPSHPEPQSSPHSHPSLPSIGEMSRVPASIRIVNSPGAPVMSGQEADSQSPSTTTFATTDDRPLRITNAACEIPLQRAGFGGQPEETLAQRAERTKKAALKATRTGTDKNTRSAELPVHGPSIAIWKDAADKDRARRLAAQRAMMAVAAGQSEQERQYAEVAQSQGAFLPPQGLRRGPATERRSRTEDGMGLGAPMASNTAVLPSIAAASPPDSPMSIRSGPGRIPASMLPKHASYKGSPLRSLVNLSINPPVGNALTPSLETPNPFSPHANSSRQSSTVRRVNFGDSSLEDIEFETDVGHNRSRTRTQTNTAARLVPFKQECTPTTGQRARNVSQRAVIHSPTESDTHTDIMAGLEYMRRQLAVNGEDAGTREGSGIENGKDKGKGKAMTSRQTRGHSEDYYASKESDTTAFAHAPSPFTVTSYRSHTHPYPIPAIAVSHPSDDATSTYSDIPIMQHTLAPLSPFNVKISIPEDLSPTTTHLVAKQHDGRALPDWLKFDKGASEFWGITPDVESGGLMKVAVDVWYAVDNEGRMGVVGGVDLVIVEQNEGV